MVEASAGHPNLNSAAWRELLQQHPLFQALSSAQLDAISPHCRLQEFQPGEFLFHAGEAATTLQLIRFGLVSLQLQVPGRGTVQLQTLRPPEILGLSWLQPDKHWLFDARASALTRTLTLSAPGLRTCMDADPTLGYILLQRLAETMGSRLQATRLQILDLYHEPVR